MSGNLLSGESGNIDQKEVTMISLSGSRTFVTCTCAIAVISCPYEDYQQNA